MYSAIIIGLLVFAAASSGALFKPGEWYFNLKKPRWNPPNWAFPVVWSLLYMCIGYAGWLVWNAAGFGLAMVVWGSQLVLNAGWSWLFFGRRRMDQAFVEVCFLWVSIALFIVLAWPISKLAAYLFMPYLLWVTIAATLNRTVWRMNPDQVPS
ncbi:MAG: TspO/MBR family protein [Ahrensia sp.]|nr:TspO/MBR family protein [Ahrensia sp.]